MERHRSILSFFKKPPASENPSSGELAPSSFTIHRRFPVKQEFRPLDGDPCNDPHLEVTGTDTPPAKLGRSVFQAGAPASNGAGVRDPKPLSSIMHKFARGNGSERSEKRDQGENSSSKRQYADKLGTQYTHMKSETTSDDCSNACFSMFNNNFNEGVHPDFGLTSDIMSPETPANRPLVSRLKRMQEDPCHTDDNDSLLLGYSKRLKSIQPFSIKEETQGDVHEGATSKFEWLNPSYIKDANGRRPIDPLFDKRTLFIPPDVLKKMSASQKQYWSVKCQYMDTVLFFKMGKFYELYELDAEIGQKELDWKMTTSGVGKCRQVGISEGGIDDAVQKLVARGYKVGRVEQFETSDQAKARGPTSVIQRKLVHVSTPSTISDGSIGADAVHLLSLREETQDLEKGSTVYGFAFVDCAALKFWIGSICDDDSCAALGALLMQVSPREVVYDSLGLSNKTQKALEKYASAGPITMQLTPMAPSVDILDASDVRKLIHSKGYFKGCLNSWASIVDSSMHHDLAIWSLGGLVGHLCRLKLEDALRNGELLPYLVYNTCLKMDGQTLVNLEIFSNNYDGSLSGTLYKHLDHCITPSGKRLLRRWICHPLKNVDEINDRLDVVEGLIKHSGVMSIIAQYLRRIPDLERLLGRVKATVGSSSSLLLPLVGEKVLKQRIRTFGSLIKGLQIGIDMLTVLQKEDHGIFALSRIIDLPMLSGFLELIKQFEVAVDDDFPHYQDHNVQDSDAETLSVLVELFVEKATEWSLVTQAINCIDVLQSFAETANSSFGSMTRPILLPVNSHSRMSHLDNTGPMLQMKGLWHPYAVGENGNGLVPNDIYLGEDSNGCHPCALLLTGPNMGGKSTLLRATCLTVILAQLGCYVPCVMCLLSPADVIFTRLGAVDRIMSGESTFFVECAETATVLRNATQDSLVLLDELGRGTSTFDGYAIAHAVFRHLVESVHCRLLFATHYHPLTKEFATHPRVSLQHMACAFKPRSESSVRGNTDLVFLYRLTSGACPESYGLEVALMAGIPKHIVQAASKAGQRMKLMISDNFKSSEGRSAFSTLHEEWFKSLLAVSKISDSCWDDDTSDILICLWHELRSYLTSSKSKK